MEIEIHQLPEKLTISDSELTAIVKNVSQDLELTASSLSFIFVNDSTLAQMHQQYLDDPSRTDVMTFNLGEDTIEGEIYISHERARDQANTFNVSFEEEITRLMIHGLLHLAGYDDLEQKDRDKMKAEENRLLSSFHSKT